MQNKPLYNFAKDYGILESDVCTKNVSRDIVHLTYNLHIRNHPMLIHHCFLSTKNEVSSLAFQPFFLMSG